MLMLRDEIPLEAKVIPCVIDDELVTYEIECNTLYKDDIELVGELIYKDMEVALDYEGYEIDILTDVCIMQESDGVFNIEVREYSRDLILDELQDILQDIQDKLCE